MDLNMMMREQATMSLQTQLDAAVTAGDTEAARKVSEKISQLAVANAPKPPAYTEMEIRQHLEAKAAWFGTDPEKSAKAAEFGKTMNPRKFATAEAFADALIAAVDKKFTPTAPAKDPAEIEDPIDDNEGGEPAAAKPRKTDAPGENEAGRAPARRTSNAVWEKLTDAPPEVRKEVTRVADKFGPKDDKGREKYVKTLLATHHRMAQQKKGK
jgi:hypothetical protein